MRGEREAGGVRPDALDTEGRFASAVEPRPTGTATALRVQLRFLWDSRRPWVLSAALLAGLALAGWIPGPLPRVLAAWPMWLLLVGPAWAFAVWHEEPPSRRRYMWAQPISRTEHSMARVAAGGLWLAAACALVILAGVGVALLGGGAARLGALSVASWVNLATAPLLGYLLVSILTVASEVPLRWLLGLILVPLLLASTLSETLDLSGPVLEALEAVGPYTPMAAILGPLPSEAADLVESLAARPARVRFAFDPSSWWIALGLWFVLAPGLVAAIARIHPDRHLLRRWMRSRPVAGTGGLGSSA